MRASGAIHRWAVILIGLSALLTYLNAMPCDFTFDDYHMIIHNNHIKDLSLLPKTLMTTEISSVPLMKGMYRPVLMASFAFNYRFARLKPVGYRIINLLIHVLNAIALYLLMVEALPGIASTAALASSLLFTVHPLHSQAITYISSRSALLATLWYLGALLAYVRWRRKGATWSAAGWLIGAWGMYLLGLGSKEIAITLPGVVVLWELVVGRRIGPVKWGRVLAAWGGFAAVGLSYLWWRQHLIGAIGVVRYVRSPLEDMLTQTVVGVFFMRMWVWPWPLSVDRAFPIVSQWSDPRWLASVAVLGALLVLAVRWFRKRPSGAFGIGWFLMAFYPVAWASSLNQVAAEHHAYLPSIGWHIALGAVLSAWLLHRGWVGSGRWRRWWMVAIAVPLVLVAGVATIRRNFDWRNGLTIWSAAVRVASASCRAHVNLGIEYEARDEWDLAMAEYETALRLVKDAFEEATVRNNIGNLYAHQHRYEEAEAAFRRAIALSPEDPSLYWNNLGLAWKDQGRLDEAIEAYGIALQMRPLLTEAHLNLGVAQFLKGQYEAAERCFQEAIAANRDYTLAYLSLGKLYEHLERWPESMGAYQEALRCDPSNPALHLNVGVLLARMGNVRALEAFERAIRLYPEYGEAHYHLAVALSVMEPPPMARVRRHLDEAVRLGWVPDPAFVQRVEELEHQKSVAGDR